jgi:hypothetical protein
MIGQTLAVQQMPQNSGSTSGKAQAGGKLFVMLPFGIWNETTIP